MSTVDSNDVLIRFRDVHKRFGDQEVLRGLDLEVRRGRTVGIMGASGTGKSVTLRHVIGLLQPDSGLVEVDGHDMSKIAAKDLAALRRRMGYVFQEGALINWLTIAENLALPLHENTKFSDERIQELVRVGLARALITDPEIILYDEPNAGLDPEISASVNQLIRELSERLQVTAIVVEHRIGCLKTVADEVAFLHEGRVLVLEPTESFFQPTHPRLVQFLGDGQD